MHDFAGFGKEVSECEFLQRDISHTGKWGPAKIGEIFSLPSNQLFCVVTMMEADTGFGIIGQYLYLAWTFGVWRNPLAFFVPFFWRES